MMLLRQRPMNSVRLDGRTPTGTLHIKSLRRVRARSGDSGDAMATMSEEEARALLRVGENDSFDSVMAAKSKLMAECGGNMERQTQIEAAYDILLMRSMQRRISGDMNVSSNVRYADVPSTPRRRGSSSSSSSSSQRSTPAQGAILPGLKVSIEPPRSANDATVQTVVLGVLAAWSLAQALLEPPEAQAADTAGLQLALAAAFAVYCFREKKRLSLGRSLGLTASCLVAGIMLGALINAWLRVDIVPLGNFSSPGVFVTEFAIAAAWSGCTFLA